MSEKLCLQWNDFQENIKIAFGNLRAHKVILAASSPFFQKLLGRNKHPHPLIYLRGVKSSDLLAIVDFLYCGEAIAEELHLKGLMGKTDEKVQNFEVDKKYLHSNTTSTTFLPDIDTNREISKTSFKRQAPNRKIHNPGENRALAIPGNNSGDFEELDTKLKSMMEKSQNRIANGHQFADLCKVCGKEGQHPHIKNHIEANHLEGIIIPCNLCDKSFRSRNALRLHKRQHQNY